MIEIFKLMLLFIVSAFFFYLLMYSYTPWKRVFEVISEECHALEDKQSNENSG